MENNNRVKTHINGFDSLLEGGFPNGSNIVLSGTAGTGKTIFSLQYLVNGVENEKEKGIYFTFEEKKDSIIKQAKQFGWDIEKLEKKEKLRIISIGVEDISKNTIDEIVEIVNNTKTKRIVIDSITTLSYLVPSDNNCETCEGNIKKFIYKFITKLSTIPDLNSILISQKDEEVSNRITEYICDGIIEIQYEALGGDFSRNLTIKKMRRTKNDEDLHPLEISNKGIIIHNLE